jgi:hypothetical protein
MRVSNQGKSGKGHTYETPMDHTAHTKHQWMAEGSHEMQEEEIM